VILGIIPWAIKAWPWPSRSATALAVFAVGVLVAGRPAWAQQEGIAVLQGLDKVTARISTFDVPVGESIQFGTLKIVVRHCRKRPPEEPPETFVFVEIDEIKRGEAPARLFGGWMFASSPALSALEHPVYDVWVVDCKSASTSAGSISQ
jgi:hypothetical protein